MDSSIDGREVRLVAGALGVALLMKLARLTRDASVPSLEALLFNWDCARERLLFLEDADASAVRDFIRTRRLDADDPAIQAALRAVMYTPLEAAELCQVIVTEAQPLIRNNQSPPLPDGCVGVLRIRTCQQAMCEVVRANLACWASAEPDTLSTREIVENVQARLARLAESRNVDNDREIIG